MKIIAEDGPISIFGPLGERSKDDPKPGSKGQRDKGKGGHSGENRGRAKQKGGRNPSSGGTSNFEGPGLDFGDNLLRRFIQLTNVSKSRQGNGIVQARTVE